MEAIILNKRFEVVRYIDAFTSFIWNEVYIGYGDFELRFPMVGTGSLANIETGNYVSIRESNRLNIIEKIEIISDVEDGDYIVISGRGIETILGRRIVRNYTHISGDFQTAVLRLVNSEFITTDHASRQFNYLSIESNPSVSNVNVEMEIEAGTNLYNCIVDLCELAKCGFMITVNPETGVFSFKVYQGLDRSYDQEDNTWVVFSNSYENLKNSDMVINMENYRNVAIVESRWSTRDENGNEVNHALSVEVGDTATSGLDRREIFVKSNIIPEEVDIDEFGTAEERVNKRQFQSYEPVYCKLDTDAYNKAIAEYNRRLEKAYHNAYATTKKLTGWRAPNPDEPTYQAYIQGADAIVWAVPVIEEVPVTPNETNRKNAENRLDYLLNQPGPDREDYTRCQYEWIFNDEAGYNTALENAQKDIEAEYAKAVADSIASAKAAMMTEGLNALYPYYTITNFTGEVDYNVQFKYGEHYGLGDIVQIVNKFDMQAKTRVVGMMLSEEDGVGFLAIPQFQSDDEAEVSF